MTSASAPELLITGGDDGSRRAIASLLERQGYLVAEAPSTQHALSLLSEQTIPLALVDDGCGDGAEVVRRIRRSCPQTQAVVLADSDGCSPDAAEQSLSAGARGYFLRPIRDWRRFNAIIERCIADAGGGGELIALRSACQGALARLKGNAPSTRRLIARLSRLAKLPDPLLIRGESGVGKELVARAVHEESPWAGGPFVAVNCAAIKPELFESEVFGHRAGAFTGAVRERAGLIESARSGTLFLDEIGELPGELQAKLLRLLEQREYRRVGEEQTRVLDARVLAATHVDLEAAIKKGDFRQDLYFRLSAFELRVPPLRERREDIQLLAYHFLNHYNQRYDRQIARIDPRVMRRLEQTAWKQNNVRELEWCIRQAVALSDDEEELTLSSFGDRLPEPASTPTPPIAAVTTVEPIPIESIPVDGLLELKYKDARDEMRRRFAAWYVTRCLEQSNHNHAYAAEIAGMKRPNFLRLLRELDLKDSQEKKLVVGGR